MADLVSKKAADVREIEGHIIKARVKNSQFMDALAEEYRDTGRPWSADRIERIAKKLKTPPEHKHTVAPGAWKCYEEPMHNEVHFINQCTTCGERVALAFDREDYEKIEKAYAKLIGGET